MEVMELEQEDFKICHITLTDGKDVWLDEHLELWETAEEIVQAIRRYAESKKP